MQQVALNGSRIQPWMLEACQKGDREAFRVLYEIYKDRVYSLALLFSGGNDAARDLAQEVFLKLFSVIGQFQSGSSFDTWLYRIVVNVCMDEHRRNRRLVFLDHNADVFLRSGDGTPEDDMSRKSVTECVRRAVSELKPKLRVPIVLRYIEGLSYEEIAAVLRCSPGTVASRLNRAHRALAKKLEHLSWEMAG